MELNYSELGDAENGVVLTKDQMQPQPDQKSPFELLWKNQEFQLVEALCRKTLYQNSYNTDAIYYLAQLFLKRAQISEAKRCFHQLNKLEQSARALIGLASVCFYLSELEKSLEYYLEASLFPSTEEEQFEIYKSVGNIYVRQGSFDLAEDFYHKAHSINPRSDVLMVNYATLALQRADHTEALRRFRQAIQINSKNDKAWVGLAMVHMQMGDFELAFANLQMAIEHEPSNKTALQVLGALPIRTEKIGYIVRQMVSYLETKNYDPDIAKLLISVLKSGKMKSLAKLEWTRAVLFYPNHQDLEQLGEGL